MKNSNLISSEFKNYIDSWREINRLIDKVQETYKQQDMKDEAIKRIELAEKELKAAKEALREEQYVTLSEDLLCFKKDVIYKLSDIYLESRQLNKVLGSSYFCYEPSTKEAYEEQNNIIKVPRLKDFEIYIENNSGSKGALVQYLNAVERYLLSKENK